jgi:hypothetical protein
MDGKVAGADGKRPKNREQLFAMGGQEARDAYNALGDKDRDKVDERMRQVALGIEPRSEQSEAVKDILWNMAEEDKARFRDLDLNHQEGLRLEDKNRLKEEQKRIRKEGVNLEADPRVGRALNDAKNAGIIDKKLTQNPQAYARFKGAFREAVILKQKEQGYDKPLTEEQHKEIADFVKSKIEVPGTLWGTNQVPIYEAVKEVPKETMAEIKRRNPGITDEAALSEYRRNKMAVEWDKLYKGKK